MKNQDVVFMWFHKVNLAGCYFLCVCLKIHMLGKTVKNSKCRSLYRVVYCNFKISVTVTDIYCKCPCKLSEMCCLEWGSNVPSCRNKILILTYVHNFFLTASAICHKNLKIIPWLEFSEKCCENLRSCRIIFIS